MGSPKEDMIHSLLLIYLCIRKASLGGEPSVNFYVHSSVFVFFISLDFSSDCQNDEIESMFQADIPRAGAVTDGVRSGEGSCAVGSGDQRSLPEISCVPAPAAFRTHRN